VHALTQVLAEAERPALNHIPDPENQHRYGLWFVYSNCIPTIAQVKDLLEKRSFFFDNRSWHHY
jgi:hypothetical protein